MDIEKQTSDNDGQLSTAFGHIDFENPIVSDVPHTPSNVGDNAIDTEAKVAAENSENEKQTHDISEAQNPKNVGIRNETDLTAASGETPGEEPSGTNSTCSEHSSASDDYEERIVESVCPKVNCKEKIIICLDMHSEIHEISFRTRVGVKLSPMNLLRQALPIFLQTKRAIDRKHEFALVILLQEAVWVKDFTSNSRDIIDFIDDMEKTNEDFEDFDMSSLFDIILDKVTLPKVDDPSVIPPPYIVRLILLYGRSKSPPVLRSSESLNMLQSSPHFFLDAFYIHQPPSNDNSCEEIYDTICDLDDKGLSYVFEVARNTTKLFDVLAQLAAHPLQRPLQKDTDYKLIANPVL